jgi:hypothetical protein
MPGSRVRVPPFPIPLGSPNRARLRGSARETRAEPRASRANVGERRLPATTGRSRWGIERLIADTEKVKSSSEFDHRRLTRPTQSRSTVGARVAPAANKPSRYGDEGERCDEFSPFECRQHPYNDCRCCERHLTTPGARGRARRPLQCALHEVVTDPGNRLGTSEGCRNWHTEPENHQQVLLAKLGWELPPQAPPRITAAKIAAST